MREWTEREELTTYWRVSKWGNKEGERAEEKEGRGKVEGGKREWRGEGRRGEAC